MPKILLYLGSLLFIISVLVLNIPSWQQFDVAMCGVFKYPAHRTFESIGNHTFCIRWHAICIIFNLPMVFLFGMV